MYFHWVPYNIFSQLIWLFLMSAAAAAKSLQSCPTLCDPTDGSPPGSPVPGILQARTLEWVAISSSCVVILKVWGDMYVPILSLGFSLVIPMFWVLFYYFLTYFLLVTILSLTVSTLRFLWIVLLFFFLCFSEAEYFSFHLCNSKFKVIHYSLAMYHIFLYGNDTFINF